MIRRPVSELRLGDDTLSYGKVTHIKRGVGRTIVMFASNAAVRFSETDTLTVLEDGGGAAGGAGRGERP